MYQNVRIKFTIYSGLINIIILLYSKRVNLISRTLATSYICIIYPSNPYATRV